MASGKLAGHLLGSRRISSALLATVIALALIASPGCPSQSPRSYTQRVGDLGLEVWVNPGQANQGQPVTIRFTVKNNGKERFVSERPDGPVVDIAVPVRYDDTDPNLPTPPTIRWSDTQSPDDPALHRLELEPGEARTIQMTYTPRVRNGSEQVEGRVWWRTKDYAALGFIYVGAVFR